MSFNRQRDSGRGPTTGALDTANAGTTPIAVPTPAGGAQTGLTVSNLLQSSRRQVTRSSTAPSSATTGGGIAIFNVDATGAVVTQGTAGANPLFTNTLVLIPDGRGGSTVPVAGIVAADPAADLFIVGASIDTNFDDGIVAYSIDPNSGALTLVTTNGVVATTDLTGGTETATGLAVANAGGTLLVTAPTAGNHFSNGQVATLQSFAFDPTAGQFTGVSNNVSLGEPNVFQSPTQVAYQPGTTVGVVGFNNGIGGIRFNLEPFAVSVSGQGVITTTIGTGVFAAVNLFTTDSVVSLAITPGTRLCCCDHQWHQTGPGRRECRQLYFDRLRDRGDSADHRHRHRDGDHRA